MEVLSPLEGEPYVLEELDLQHLDFGDIDVALGQALRRGLGRRLKCLRLVSLCRNSMRHLIAALAEGACPILERLDGVDLQELLPALQTGPSWGRHLKALSLGSCEDGADAEAMYAMAVQALSPEAFPQLKTLIAEPYSEQDLTPFFAALRRHPETLPQVEVLEVSFDEFEPDWHRHRAELEAALEAGALRGLRKVRDPDRKRPIDLPALERRRRPLWGLLPY
jgi:hypothetical protein